MRGVTWRTSRSSGLIQSNLYSHTLLKSFDDIKARYRIPDAWRDLNLPGEPAKSCRTPWRDDRSPSFSVHDEGKRWKDFSTEESGDVGDFVAKATGWCVKDSLEWCRERAGINSEFSFQPPLDRPRTNNKPRKELRLPSHSPGRREEWQRLARLREIDVAAVELAVKLGVLVFGRVCDHPCWILHEPGVIAEARRLDGVPFPAMGSLGERKAHTLAGSRKDWPMGLHLLDEAPSTVLLVEGGPDWLAALHFVIKAGRSDLLPVAMMGRSNRIAPEALRWFTGLQVRIFPHCDPDGGGLAAAKRWGEQLRTVVRHVDAFTFDGLVLANNRSVKDLNDAALITGEEATKLEELLP